jgi:hypothetical protein
MADAKDAKKAVEKVVDKVAGVVEVELKEARAGFHTIFCEKGIAEFKDGIAKVRDEIAKELKDLGLIK